MAEYLEYAERYISYGHRTWFYQLISNGKILEMYSLRKRKNGALLLYPIQYSRWRYMVMVEDDYVTIVNDGRANG